MMKTSMLALLAASALAMPAQAAVIGDFRLDGSAANQAGGPLTLTTDGSLGATGITFDANEGTLISGFSGQSDYSLELRFSLDSLSGYRKIANIPGVGSDTGLYNLNSALNFYPIGSSGPVFTAGQLATVVVTRNAAGDFTGYVNGTAVLSFNNAGATTLPNALWLLRDDTATGGGESSSGFVDYIRVYDTALTAQQVAGLTPPGPVNAVPEPATWAMMIGGFALAGSAARRRRPASAIA
ncbi:PEPxxWA-CTERM sorting domain-containing protein [Sphingomonas sp.]|jgi:hypothetical protein|uniref:PEPxxWA-CTERM sorting domain-containing protein n=1 Tax=Sphingomonas sp. TaxID=28214 RepID=UPI002DF46537|nr:PEPxxWA-CTERM sorting domain-containing protein [Sphingomonas sp.]